MQRTTYSDVSFEQLMGEIDEQQRRNSKPTPRRSASFQLRSSQQRRASGRDWSFTLKVSVLGGLLTLIGSGVLVFCV